MIDLQILEYTPTEICTDISLLVVEVCSMVCWLSFVEFGIEIYCLLLMQVYQIGGYDENYNYLNNTYVYDPATTTWTRLADMPTARGDLMCVNFLGEVYVLGGYYVSNTMLIFQGSLFLQIASNSSQLA